MRVRVKLLYGMRDILVRGDVAAVCLQDRGGWAAGQPDNLAWRIPQATEAIWQEVLKTLEALTRLILTRTLDGDACVVTLWCS